MIVPTSGILVNVWILSFWPGSFDVRLDRSEDYQSAEYMYGVEGYGS